MQGDPREREEAEEQHGFQGQAVQRRAEADVDLEGRKSPILNYYIL